MPETLVNFGEHELVAYAKVEKLDGRIIYYKIIDGENVEINEETYKREAE